MTSVKTVNSEGKARYPITAVHILKCHGKSSLESELVDGFALNNTRASQAMPKVAHRHHELPLPPPPPWSMAVV